MYLQVYLEAVLKVRHYELGPLEAERVRMFDISEVPGLVIPEVEEEPLSLREEGEDPTPLPHEELPPVQYLPRRLGRGLPGPLYSLGFDGGTQDGHRVVTVTERSQVLGGRSTYTLHILKKLVQANFRVTSDLILGFNREGNFFLPEIRLSLINIDDSPVLQADVPWLETTPPFGGIDRDGLKQFILDLCFEDAHGILLRAMSSPEQSPASLRVLIPELASSYVLSQELLNIATIKQIGEGDPPDFCYLVDGDLLYWPIEIIENLSAHIS